MTEVGWPWIASLRLQKRVDSELLCYSRCLGIIKGWLPPLNELPYRGRGGRGLQMLLSAVTI